MQTKNKIIIANWKMKLGIEKSVGLAKEFKEIFYNFKAGEIIVCPSTIAISKTSEVLSETNIKLGGQNVFWEESGSYTGEISPEMLIESGCDYVIIGHSERRKYLLENYAMIHQKLKEVLYTDKLTPIICIGEENEDRKTDQRDIVLVEQLQQALGGIDLIGNQQVVVAYEPIWAIGSGIAIEPSEAEYAHKIIHLALKDMFDLEIANNNFRIIYGGSVTSENVNGFVNLEHLDGLLVGGSSLDAGEFRKIAEVISK